MAPCSPTADFELAGSRACRGREPAEVALASRRRRSAVATRRGQPAAVSQRAGRVHPGWLSSPKWSARRHVQHVGAGEQLARRAGRGRTPRAAAPAGRRRRWPTGCRGSGSGWRRPGGSGRAAAAARPRPARATRSCTPTERWSRIRPNAAVSGSRAEPAAPCADAARRSARRGAGVPRVTTSVTRSAPRLARRRWPTAPAARIDQPAHRVADQRDPVDRAPATPRPGRCSSAASATPFSRERRARCWRAGSTGVQPELGQRRRRTSCRSGRGAGPSSDSFSHSPCRKTATRPVASGNAAASAVGVERRRRARRARTAIGIGQPRPLARPAGRRSAR